MKYVILVGDGMADYPIAELRDRTPLEVARTPNMDLLAAEGAGGLVHTIPEGMEPGSDVANLSIMGVDPARYYTGRGPLEAASMGIEMGGDEIAFRCNLVTVSDDVMVDYSGGHISSEEGKVLIELLDEKFAGRGVRFFPGVSYRNLMLAPERLLQEDGGLLCCVPPHDIIGRPIREHYPSGKGSRLLREIMQASHLILSQHPVNKVKIDLGENPANMIWLWGGGKKPSFGAFEEERGLSGAVISAVDLVKGIGKLLGFEVINVPGATGYYDTNYSGKAAAALTALERVDCVLVHVEAADEAGHNGDRTEKVRAIENFDAKVVGTILQWLRRIGDSRVMLLPDHATPLSLRTHVADPVPFCICGTGIAPDGMPAFNEKAAVKGSLNVDAGFQLMDRLLAI
ncbi:MAG: cofactor-independent phosphoglycerate mutase [bacterium]